MDNDDDDGAGFVHRSTAIRWARGDFSLDVMLDVVLTPEAAETLLTRSRREFVAGARQLEVVPERADD